jgi:SagB-type dehydrogenase family enzyme
MNNISVLSLIFFVVFLIIMPPTGNSQKSNHNPESTETMKMPSPAKKSGFSIEEALLKRRSIRKYKDKPLTLAEISQLLWSAQGITNERGFRTAPSAGALYPLEIYVVANKIEGLPAGVYKYIPAQHELKKIEQGNKLAELTDAALMQTWVENSSAVIVIAAVYERTTIKYGKRGIRYVHMEVGSAAQNIYLQAVSLNLGTTFIGAFDDEQVKNVLKLTDDEHPLSIMPIGKI